MNYENLAYLRSVFAPDALDRTARRAVKTLRPFAGRFDAIAFTGHSGTIVAPLVAVRLHKPMVLVRKPGSEGHMMAYESRVQGASAQGLRYLILDDVVSTGATVRRVIQELSENRAASEFAGLYVYEDSFYRLSSLLGMIGREDTEGQWDLLYEGPEAEGYGFVGMVKRRD